MENYTRKERAQYNIDRERRCERLGITTNQYNRFRRLAEKLSRIDEWRCNGTRDTSYNGHNEYTEEEYLRDEILLIETIAYQAGLCGLKGMYHQTDPRGCSLYLDLDHIPYDNYTSAAAIY